MSKLFSNYANTRDLVSDCFYWVNYFIRRLSIDYGVDILINTKNAKLYIDSVISCYSNFKEIGDCDLKIS